MMRAMTAEEMVLTLVRFALILLVVYGGMAVLRIILGWIGELIGWLARGVISNRVGRVVIGIGLAWLAWMAIATPIDYGFGRW